MARVQDDRISAQRAYKAGRRCWLRRLLWLCALLPLLTVVQVLVLRVMPPPFTAFMAARQLQAWRQGDADFQVAYDWRPAMRISPQLQVAVVAAEDQRFAEHQGFDMQAIERAQRHNARMQARADKRARPATRLRGASTISQQTAKNLFLWQGAGWMRWVRKGLEAWYTLLIEQLWPKQRILEMYVNVAEFGDGIYGAQAAARSYWRKDASQLSAAEAARLAAVLPSPRRYSVVKPGPYVQRRSDAIQRQMHAIGGSDYLKRLK